jgi:mRNA-degrading endonuclease RelE of RelBE toxin-antitoxin system
MDYRLLIAIEVVECVERLPGRTRQAIRNTFKMIGSDPLGRSDAVEHDSIGRRMQIAIVGDYALMYWVDDADRHVKILDIHAADR